MKNIFYNKKRAYDRITLADKNLLRILGIELKRRRLAADKILSDYSCGCSLSYLSKFENGRIIPKYDVVVDYCEQNGISAAELEMMLQANDYLNRIIHAYAKGDYDLLLETAYQTKSFENYKAFFIQMFNQLIYNDYSGIRDNLNKCSQLYDDFEIFDKAIYTFFELYLFMKDKRYFDIIKKYNDFLYTDNKALNALITRLFYMACLESFYIWPINNKNILNDLLLFNGLIDYKFIDAYNRVNIMQNKEIQEYEVAYLSKQNQILYYGLNKDIDNLKALEEKQNTNYELLLIYLFLGKVESARRLFCELEGNKFDKTTLIKIEFFIDYQSLDDFSFANKISDYYLLNLADIHDLYFINNLKEIIYDVSLKTGRPTLMRQGYQVIHKILLGYFKKNQLLPL